MKITLEGVTIDQLVGLYQFLGRDTNQKSVLSSNVHTSKIEPSPFVRVKECEIPPSESGKLVPTFLLTLEVKERECLEKPSEKNPDEKSLPVPLHLLAKLMKALELFPDEFYDRLPEPTAPTEATEEIDKATGENP